MGDCITHEAVTTAASFSSEDAPNTNIGDSNINIVNRGDRNRIHAGPDNRYNEGVVVNGGSAYIAVQRKSSDILNELRRAPTYYDSSIRKQAQRCMHKTRVTILNTIYKWADGVDDPPIFWLHGPAGTGKSTIAHTVANKCRRRGRLGASFFFAHANAECSDPNLFFSTIAYQLSRFVPDLRQHIIDGVRGHPSPQNASISTQFEEFILTPLCKLSNGPAREPIIVVVDAFDECSDPRKASEILELISAKIPRSPLRLKFLITSRPEPEIRSILHPDIHRISRSFDLLRDVNASSTDEDIKRFLRFHLGRIGKEYDLPSWPRDVDVEGLAQQAGGLFIFAQTAIELVRDKDVMDPESQLAMLKNIGTNGAPAFNLNALYLRILQKAMPETATTMVQDRVITIIHAIVGLRAPLALCAIERLLGLDRAAIRAALNRLRSIFIIPDNDEDTVQVIHSSFARYITNKESCTEKRFFADPRQLHSQLAKHCLKKMKTRLKQNICYFKDFTTVEAPIKDEKSSDVDLQMLSAELKYSCENFAAHVFSADWQDSELCETVAEWVNQYLPYWLEVLALIGSLRDALPSLRLLTKFCGMQTSKAARSKSRRSILLLLPKWLKAVTVAPNQGPQFCQQLLADAIRMVSESYDDIKRFPHQIYSSCSFCPLGSPLFKQYSRLSTVRVLSGERKHWGPLLHAFKDPDGDVISLTFSPDGTILASCSSVGKILLWNLETRESRVLACHTLRRDTAFTFSADSKYIAADGNVYRATTGEEVLIPGSCSAFSSDGLYIAIGCDDGTIRLHDLQASNLSLFGELFGHGGTITTLAFSSDNKFLVSASWDHTIRVWNCTSLDMMKQIPCGGLRGHVTFSPNKMYVAARCKYSLQDKESVWVADIRTDREKSIDVSTEEVYRYKLPTTIFSPSGNYIASYNGGAVDVVRGLAATQLSCTCLDRGFNSFITSFSFTPNEQSLLVGDLQGLIRSWRIPKYGRAGHRFEFEYKAHSGAVQAITFSHNAKHFASASIDGSICVWDSTSVGLHEPYLTGLTNILFRHGQKVIFSPDGQTVVITSSDALSKIDATTGRSIFHKKGVMHRPTESLIFSADGKYFASDSIQGLLFWDTGSMLPNWGRHIAAHAFSPDATHYAVLFTTGRMWIHDLRNGESRKVVHRYRYLWQLKILKFSHDSRHLVLCEDGDISVFDVEKGVQTDLNLPVRGFVFNCAFSPRDQHIVIAHSSGLDVLEYLAKEPNVREILCQDGYRSVEFSPDGKYILASTASAREDPEEPSFHLFHPDTLEILYTIKHWSRQHVDQAMREFRKTGRLLNLHPLFQPPGYEDFPYLLDRDGWVITASSKRLCRLPVTNRGKRYDVNGNRIVVVSPEGKVTLIQFGPNPVCIPTPP
ncbi:hypothetical protein JOM56_000250 [Amanita muscaria]